MPTTHHVLEETWQEISSGPLGVEVRTGTALVHFGETKPAEDTLAYHTVRSLRPDNWISNGGPEKLFAKRGEVECDIVVTNNLIS